MPFGEAAHMGLVDDCVFPRYARPLRPAPGEGGVDDAALEREWGAVAVIEGEVIARFHLVAEQSRVPLHVADDLLGIGINQ